MASPESEEHPRKRRRVNYPDPQDIPEESDLLSYPDDQARSKKEEINAILCQILQAEGFPTILKENSDLRVAVLDSHSLQTSTALVTNQIAVASQIVIPNPFEFDTITENVKQRNELQGLIIRKMYSGQYFSQEAQPGTLVFLYLDYTCTLQGCKRTRPKPEIALVFKKSLFHDRAAFGMTLHLPRQMEDQKLEAIDQAIQFVRKTAESFDTTTKVLDSFAYENVSSQMMFLLFRVDRSAQKITPTKTTPTHIAE